MAKSGHIIRTAGERNRSIQPEQCCYDILLDCGIDTVNHVRVRFGTLDDMMDSNGDKTYTWLKIIDTVDTEYKAGQKAVVASMNDDQLPAPADSCFYQLLCEIYGEHDEPETLMTKPVKLGDKILENIPSISTTQKELIQAMS